MIFSYLSFFFPNYLSDLIQKTSSTLKEIKTTLNLWEIFKFKSQQRNILVLMYIWFVAGFCFYGLLLNLENLSGDVIMDSILTFIGEIIAELASGYFAEEYGRVIVLKISGLIGAFGFFSYEIISSNIIKSFLVFLTSFGFSATINVLFIYSPEVFPTTVRSTVMGFLFLMSRLGALCVPPLSALIPHFNYVFAFLALIQSLLAFYLEETLEKDLEDDIPELIRPKSFLSTFNYNNNIGNRSIRSRGRSGNKFSFRERSNLKNGNYNAEDNSLMKSIKSDYYLKIDA